MKKVILNNSLIDESEAFISAFDRGVRFGDGVFETIRVENSLPYLWELHLKRLRNGLNTLDINSDFYDNLLDNCLKLIEDNKTPDCILRIMITRGVGSIGYLPTNENPPTIFIETSPIPEQPSSAKLWLSSYKQIPSECFPQHIKSNQGLHSTLCRMEADKNGCKDALILNIDGSISETSSGNIFWVKGGKLYTPSLECNILPGTMRNEIIRTSDLPVDEGKFYLDDIKDADRVFITNSVWKTLTICSLEPTGFCWNVEI